MSQISQFLQQHTTSNTAFQSFGPNGYYVMPDFHKTLPNFRGTEPDTEASNWIRDINITADLHDWPEFFKLEIVRTKLQGPTRSWYLKCIFVG